MQKRLEKKMKITIVPATGSKEKEVTISYRESNYIYQAISKLMHDAKK